jgi:hypothetical protein
MAAVQDDCQQLEQMLARTPVIGEVHPLLPLALSSSVRIVKCGDDLLSELDDMLAAPQSPMLILQHDHRLAARFPKVSFKKHPPIQAINRNMHHHLDYARDQLLTTLRVADALVEDVIEHRYDIVVLMLIDGLSYGDIVDWIETAMPCFVDGPSVTYRLADDQRTVLPTVGFPSIVGSPGIFSQLHDVGYRDALGYTYWAPDSNAISDCLFRQIPTRRVSNFEAILADLRSFRFKQPTYIQILREGLDGLAHSKREVSRAEIEGAISAIQQDVERVLQVLSAQKHSACLYLTADHGILWKTEHDWQTLDAAGSKPRYSTICPMESACRYAVRYERSGQVYYSFIYPYLGSRIKADDSGVHGGLSYQESIVPFAKFEVR